MPQWFLCVLIGLGAGAFGGLAGMGGGIVIVPALVTLLGMSQHSAQATTLALMVPPIGILASRTYYREGFVDLGVAAFICPGVVLGGLAGAKVAVEVPKAYLQKAFGIALLPLSVRMVLGH